ncbi:YfbR-like 5'-deoxynucleotidase [Parvularcula lutaonensis]|uniref:YfbR-like 5'-deoxynucleotidase n=1 Tax=Parvularcula lutaonensis TaxID=491923 RepID=A0ABV7M817_9PROT|nr:HD family hydrolase [Parvularcula lutaonensis]GGY43634.1 metal-dependent phosphohydrolase [Parvularcula lutaonensis]
MTKNPPRAWQRMLSGRRLDILDPSPLDVEIEDIAHGLARVARWNGQTIGTQPFNVAQHSVVVLDMCMQMKPSWPREWQLAALLHDAPEYVIGDMISPFKAVLGGNYKKVEHGLHRAIHIRFGLPPELPAEVEKLIKKADRACAYFEATQLAGFSVEEAEKLFPVPKKVEPLTLEILSTEESQTLYLQRFAELQ